MAMYYVAVDCGKADTKVCLKKDDGSVQKRIIPTTLYEASGMEDLQRETEKNILEVCYQGKSYVIGAPASGMVRDNSKKNISWHLQNIECNRNDKPQQSNNSSGMASIQIYKANERTRVSACNTSVC